MSKATKHRHCRDRLVHTLPQPPSKLLRPNSECSTTDLITELSRAAMLIWRGKRYPTRDEQVSNRRGEKL